MYLCNGNNLFNVCRILYKKVVNKKKKERKRIHEEENIIVSIYNACVGQHSNPFTFTYIYDHRIVYSIGVVYTFNCRHHVTCGELGDDDEYTQKRGLCTLTRSFTVTFMYLCDVCTRIEER